MPDAVTPRWRTGRTLGRTLYIQHGDDPTKADQFVGLMESAALAELVCEAVNARLEMQRLA